MVRKAVSEYGAEPILKSFGLNTNRPENSIPGLATSKILDNRPASPVAMDSRGNSLCAIAYARKILIVAKNNGWKIHPSNMSVEVIRQKKARKTALRG